jgi:hypothetical protein
VITDPHEVIKTFEGMQTTHLAQAYRVGPENAEEERELNQTIANVRREIATKTIFVKPVLQDFDQFNRGDITQLQFRRALSVLGFNFSDRIMELIAWKYTSLKDADNINYSAFLHDVDPLPQDPSPYSSSSSNNLKHTLTPNKSTPFSVTSTSAFTSNSCDSSVSLQSILARMQTEVLRRRLILIDAFSDFDKVCSLTGVCWSLLFGCCWRL